MNHKTYTFENYIIENDSFGKNLIVKDFSKINDINQKILFQQMLNHPEITLITSVKKFIDSNSNKDLQIMFDKDIFATDVYSLGFENNSFGNLDFKNGIIK